jgi:hypothetical protein
LARTNLPNSQKAVDDFCRERHAVKDRVTVSKISGKILWNWLNVKNHRPLWGKMMSQPQR